MRCSVVIVDDEPLALALIENYIQRIDIWEIKAAFSDAQLALEYVEKQPVDLIISDINMPDITGLQFVQKLGTRSKTHVIFITAHKEHAIESFELDVIDYLVKPVSFPRFEKALQKVQAQILLKSGIHAEAPTIKPFYINVFSEYQQIKINIADIIYLQSMGDYVKIFIHNAQKPIITLERIKNFEEMLAPKGFLRIHRSYIVNPPYVASFSKTKLMVGNVWLPISQTYLTETMENLNER